MKARGVLVLVVLGLMAVLAAMACASTSAPARTLAGPKIGVSIAGYSTDFWAAYVQYEKQFAKAWPDVHQRARHRGRSSIGHLARQEGLGASR